MTRYPETFARRLGLLLLSSWIVASALAATASAQNPDDLQKYGIVILANNKERPSPKSLPEASAQRQHELLEMARDHPSDFNYPWIDWKTGEVVCDVVTEAAVVRAK